MINTETKNLLELFKLHNVILPNGQLNTRWKIMAEKMNISEVSTRNKTEFFKHFWPIRTANCSVCGYSILHTFKLPNFLNGDHAFNKVCSRKCQNKSTSDKVIEYRKDKNYEAIRRIKFKNTVSKIDADGSTLASRIAIKAAATKATTIINGVSVATRQKIRTAETRVKNGSQIPDNERSPFHLYRKEVHKLSSKEKIHTLSNYEKRGHFNKGGYHLDHIFSIFDGFRLGIPAQVIASIVNLRFIPAVENTSKSGKSDMLLSDLIQKYFDLHTNVLEIFK